MADADRDSDIGDDSPVSARSEGETSGEHSYESSDEGVARDSIHQHPDHPQEQTQTIPHLPIPHAPLMTHHTNNHQLNSHQLNHQSVNHQIMNNHQINHHIRRNSPRPLDSSKVNRNSLPTNGGSTVTVRDDFEALKSSLHPHLSSLASLAQGTPITGPSSVFAVANAGPSGGFSYAPSAFLAPAPPPPPQPTGSASSTSSSEGSAAGWSFEEQYKQVRQLYEISDDPGRKEFLDDLFSFMQRRGTPINRLPIMAKSVLDLYELYNLVIARGGLVEVINKKLWQEIIKGLQLPSSITSAAFTLRTQYMKYLYAYECDKKNLSTQSELDAAIEGNKREGRRSSGQYEAQQAQAQAQAAALAMQQSSRVIPASIAQLPPHMQPLALAMAGGVPGVPRLPSLPPLPTIPPHPPHVSPQEMEFRVREYMRFLQQQQSPRNSTESQEGSEVNGHAMMAQGAAALNALEVQRLALWSLYNNNTNSQPDLEPQRDPWQTLSSLCDRSALHRHLVAKENKLEALNLSESPNSSTSGKREVSRSPVPLAKRRAVRPPSPAPCSSRSLSPPRPASPPPAPRSPPRPNATRTSSPLGSHHLNINGHSPVNGAAAFKITTRGDAASGDQQLDVSIEINGVTYAGVLFPSHHGDDEDSQRHMIS